MFQQQQQQQQKAWTFDTLISKILFFFIPAHKFN